MTLCSLHSGVAIDLLALGDSAWKQADKETFREEEQRGQSQAAMSPDSCTVELGGNCAPPPQQRTRFRG